MSKCVIVPNFAVIGQSMIDMAIFRFSRWHFFDIFDFNKFKILTVNRVMSLNMRHRAKFVAIGQTVAEI